MNSDAVIVAAKNPNKYVSGVNQPRDIKGKFRTVLARLKEDLGTAGLGRAIEQIEQIENLDNAGNYFRAVDSSSRLLSIIDRLDAGSLNAEALENIRSTSRELGTVISNLPLPFGMDSEKVRFSDLPPVLRELVEDMIERVETKIGKEDADEATAGLRSYMSGGDLFSQSEVSSEMSKLLRLLT